MKRPMILLLVMLVKIRWHLYIISLLKLFSQEISPNMRPERYYRKSAVSLKAESSNIPVQCKKTKN